MTLSILEEKLREAKEPSRELDAWIIYTLFPDATFMFDPGDVRTRRAAEYGKLSDFPIQEWGKHPSDWDALALEFAARIPHFEHNSTRLTSSIDAAVGLVERVRPGCAFILTKLSDTEFGFDFGKREAAEPAHAEAPTAALAICLALVRALQGDSA